MPWRQPPARRRRDDYDYYPHSEPIRPKDGIQPRSERGAFAETWWAKRWIKVLESFGWGNRLQRGRSYARSGQVVQLDLAVGQVTARVQGSRPTPYKVTIRVTPLTDAQWDRVADALAEQAVFAAQLLGGEMPRDIETAFEAAGVPLFPQSAADIQTECSCPDFANPCKHIAAAYYLLGERFDADPFLIFHLRGRTQEQILNALRARRAAQVEAVEDVPAAEPAPALADQLDHFYAAGDELDSLSARVAAPALDAALLRQWGDAPVGTDADLRAVYQAMTAYALAKVQGEEEELTG